MNIMIALMMTTLVAAGSLSYFNNCSKAVCSVPYNACANDKGCASTMDVCEKRCTTNDNSNCIQQCFYSSNSLVAQKLAICASSNQCFLQLECFGDITCPTTCKAPTKVAFDQCSTEALYPTQECISAYLVSMNREDCAEKKCVCSNIDSYVVGCYC